MKLKYQNKRQAFTMVEILVVSLLLSFFFGGLFVLYRNNAATFSITVWKQERSKQFELFWAQLRKALEEASDKVDLTSGMGSPSPTLNNRTEAPLLYRALPNDVTSGAILEWNVTKINISFEPPYVHSTENKTYELIKDQSKLQIVEYAGQKKRVLATLNDVSNIELKVSTIVIIAGEEDISYSGGANGVGSFIEIFLTLQPSENHVRKQGLNLTQSQKFRLNVLASQI